MFSDKTTLRGLMPGGSRNNAFPPVKNGPEPGPENSDKGAEGMRRNTSKLILVALLSLIVIGSAARAVETPAVASVERQAEICNGWLMTKLDKVLPELMRRENIDMWLVICREYNEDPVYLSLVPYGARSARRLTILVFYDRGGNKGIERFGVCRYGMGALYPTVWDPAKEGQWQTLAAEIKKRNPKRIGIDEGEVFGFGDGLTAGLKKLLVQAVGPEYSGRLVSAEKLAVGWLERRLPEELAMYPHIAAVAHSIIARAFSNEVIIPNVTRADEVEAWMRKETLKLGLDNWFHPEVDIQRPASGEESPTGGAPKGYGARDNTIRPGDLLHCDFGIIYFGLCTDTQQMAYVLKRGETDVPDGFKKGMAACNRLQDIHLEEMKVGLTGNQALAVILKRAKSEGIRPSVYSHALGVNGHAAGPVVGYWDMQQGVPGLGDYPLHADTAYSIELNILAAIPEWGGRDAQISLEQDAVLTAAGVSWLDKRQTAFHIIK